MHRAGIRPGSVGAATFCRPACRFGRRGAAGVQNGLVGIQAVWPFITFTDYSLVTAWEDHRDAATQGVDLYVSTLPDGSPVSTAPLDQTHPALAQVDVACGFQAGCKDIVVAWQDGRGSLGDDIFANLTLTP